MDLSRIIEPIPTPSPPSKRSPDEDVEIPPSSSSPPPRRAPWTADEDAQLLELRGRNVMWEDIGENFPGRTVMGCRLRYRNYLEKKSKWNGDKKDKLARLYER